MKVLKRLVTTALAAATAAATIAMTASATVITDKDPNGSGSLSLSDALAVDAYVYGFDTPYSNRLWHLDINGNGIISPYDSWLIRSEAAGASMTGVIGSTYDNVEYAVTGYNDPVTYIRHDCINSQSSDYIYDLDSEEFEINDNTEMYDWQVDDSNRMTVNNADDKAVVRLDYYTGAMRQTTGTIVGDHIIATAAHCVYDSNEGFKSFKIKIVGTNGVAIDDFDPKYIHIPQAYVTGNGMGAYDYALIYVQRNLRRYGKYDIGIATDEFVYPEIGGSIPHETVNITGFPYDLTYMPQGAVVRYRYLAVGEVGVYIPRESGEEPSLDIWTNRFRYYANTASGFSGSPVYVEETYNNGGFSYNSKTMIGIHTTGYSNLDNNGNISVSFCAGIRFTPAITKFYLNNEYIC